MARKRKQAKKNIFKGLITKLNPRSPISEQYRTVRTNLQFSSVDETLRSIMITSPGPADGKSVTAANLAVVYAQQGKKILLIDADMRKPSVHYKLQLDNLQGLSNVLVGEKALENAIVTSDVANLDILTCGPIPPNPSELLGSNKMQQILKQAQQNYDLVLFDSPPILAVADAQIIANICDGSILVVRSKQTEHEEARKAVDVLQSASAKLLGTVLNDQQKKEANYYYYYYGNK